MELMSSGGLVTESRDRTAVTYVINEKSLFFSNGLKVLQSNYKSGFVKCSKGTINGKIRLTYDISHYASLAELMPSLNDRKYLTIINNLLQTTVDLNEIGFLQRESISIEPKDVYVDRETLRTYLIYLPLDVHPAPNAHIVFEKAVRENLVKLANNYRNVVSGFVIEICRDLMNKQVGLQAIISKIGTQDLQTSSNYGETKTGLSHSTSNPTKTYGGDPQKKEPAKKPENLSNPSELSDGDKPAENRPPMSKSRVIMPPKNGWKPYKPAARILLFFLIYIVVILTVMLVVFHYYSNSGMTLGFLVLLLGGFLFAFMSPVIFLSRKGNKKNENTKEAELNSGDGLVGEGYIPPVVLKSVNNPVRLEFFINRKEYVIGKVPGLAAGVIPLDKTIGDAHCKIIWDGQFFIKDLESEYGTFVNEVRIVPGQAFPIKNGDMIRLSKHVFSVCKL